MNTNTTVETELLSIYNRHGYMHPDLVVREASDPAHPLHANFEWDDTVAAEAWRREQAQSLIRTVFVHTEPAGEVSPERVRAWVAARDTLEQVDGPHRSGYYLPFAQVAADPTSAAAYRRKLEADWVALRKRAAAVDGMLAQFRRDLEGEVA